MLWKFQRYNLLIIIMIRANYGLVEGPLTLSQVEEVEIFTQPNCFKNASVAKWPLGGDTHMCTSQALSCTDFQPAAIRNEADESARLDAHIS